MTSVYSSQAQNQPVVSTYSTTPWIEVAKIAFNQFLQGSRQQNIVQIPENTFNPGVISTSNALSASFKAPKYCGLNILFLFIIFSLFF